MKVPFTSLVLSTITLIACTPQAHVYTPVEIETKCNQERQEASGVQGKVSVGANSKTGMGLGLSLSVNDKYLRGVDPQAVYDQCVQKLNDHNARQAALLGEK